MKIRIKGNSVRFRLTRSEVSEFCDSGYVEGKTKFGDATFIYGVRVDTNIEGLGAEFKEGKIVLNVSDKMAGDWDTSDQVGFEDTQSTPGVDALHLLLEKDFNCMSDRGEDESDNYPNPKMASIPK